MGPEGVALADDFLKDLSLLIEEHLCQDQITDSIPGQATHVQ